MKEHKENIQLGFMRWESTKSSQPERGERCLFIVGEYPEDTEISFGYRLDDAYFDLLHVVDGEPSQTHESFVTWWCRLCGPLGRWR